MEIKSRNHHHEIAKDIRTFEEKICDLFIQKELIENLLNDLKKQYDEIRPLLQNFRIDESHTKEE